MPTNEAAAVVVPLALAAFSLCSIILGSICVALVVSRTPNFGAAALRIGVGSMVVGVVGLVVFGRLY